MRRVLLMDNWLWFGKCKKCGYVMCHCTADQYYGTSKQTVVAPNYGDYEELTRQLLEAEDEARDEVYRK